MQHGLEGPLDLCPLIHSILWMAKLPQHTQTPNRSTCLLTCFVICHGRESREACVSGVFFLESLWLPYRSSSFSVTHHVAAPSPQAVFSICKSSLSSMQFYSVSSPPHLYIVPLPLTCMASLHTPMSFISHNSSKTSPAEYLLPIMRVTD